MLWATSPACTELETHVLDWMVELLGLPDRFLSVGAGGGVIEDSASSATLCALLAARQRAEDAGVELGALVAYASAHTHSSLEKAARVAGLGTDQVRVVAVDDTFAIVPEALGAAIAEDRAAGLTPFFCCATVGTTSSLAVDPVPALAEVVADTGVWLHVDGAMAGSAAVCPELRWVNDGLDRADSYAFNPHKWLFTNFDCTCFWVADRAALLSALSILPEYLRNEASASGRGHRLPGLAGPAGTPVPGPQALVRHPPLRRRRAGPPRAPSRRPRRAPGRPGSRPTTGSPSPPRPASAWCACATSTATPPPRPCSTPSTRPGSSP